MSDGGHLERPPLPDGFDDSRARERRDDPAGWRFSDPERAAVHRVIEERRDIRRFRPEPLPDDLLRRLLAAAHAAPSVGLSQPWHFVVVRSEETKLAMQAHVAHERLVQRDHFDERARRFLDLKIEGIRDAPLSIVVCCDRGDPTVEVLGRHTIRDTDLYSTACAIENLWLAARAEGVGVGWVSFYRPERVQSLLGLPEGVEPIAWLCVGYPDERPVRPGLEAAGWERRLPLETVVHEERWRGTGTTGTAPGSDAAPGHTAASGVRPIAPPVVPPVTVPAWWTSLARGVRPGDTRAAIAARDASDELVKPAGSLGLLETLVERWAQATGMPPPLAPRPGILVFAADHGVALRGVSLYPQRVSGQVAAAAARGETAIGVLARALGAELVVADVGLAGPARAGLEQHRVADGSADICAGPALGAAQLQQAVETGHRLAAALCEGVDLLVVGEIGIGNTTVASTLLAALSGLSPEEVCGRGSGLDAQGLARKRAACAAALAVNRPSPTDPLECLRLVGGLELAALAGALLAAAKARTPVLLDGFAVGVTALATCSIVPAVRDYLIAGHLSAEPAHRVVLDRLGLEPLLDLRMRLGEASGAAAAIPLIALAARLHTEMRTFTGAEVDRRGPRQSDNA